MSDTTKKRSKFAGKLLFVCLLLGILYYSFRDSMGDMLTELANVSPQVVMSLFVTVILYHICEEHITWLIVHKLAQLQAESRSLLRDPLLLLRLFLCNVLKFTPWYIIPWIVFCNSLRGESGGDWIRRSRLHIAVPASPAGGQSPVCRASLPIHHHAVTLCHWRLFRTG